MTDKDARVTEATPVGALEGVVRLPVRPDASAPQSKFMSIDDVADYLGLSQRWVYDQVRTGRLPARLIARSWRLRRDEVDAFADSFLWSPDEATPTATAVASGQRRR